MKEFTVTLTVSGVSIEASSQAKAEERASALEMHISNAGGKHPTWLSTDSQDIQVAVESDEE